MGYFEDHPPSRKMAGPFVPRLAELLRSHPSLAVRVECAQYLGEIGWPHPEAVDALRLALAESDPHLLAACIWALGAFRKAAEPAVEALLPQARHPDREVRWRVAWAIDAIGQAPAGAAEVLEALFTDPDGLVRGYAIGAFGKVAQGSDAAAARVAALASSDPDSFVRAEASKVARVWGGGAEPSAATDPAH